MTKENMSVPVLKLHETHADARDEQSDAMAVFRIWTLLSGGDSQRDLTIANRKV